MQAVIQEDKTPQPTPQPTPSPQPKPSPKPVTPQPSYQPSGNSTESNNTSYTPPQTIPASVPEAVKEPITILKTPVLIEVSQKKGGRARVSWEKIKKNGKTKKLRASIKGIQVQYSTDPAFLQNVDSRNIEGGRVSIVLKLKRKTVYNVRIRYVGNNGYSEWSNVIKVKIN